MNPEREEFQDLRRLLALKRHEQPPPGYFDRFSSQVIARIQAGEQSVEITWVERILSPVQRAWAAFQSQPAMAGAFGLATCGLLAASLVYSDPGDSHALAIMHTPDLEDSMPFSVPEPTARQTFHPVLYSLQSPASGFAPAQQAGSIFEPIRRPRATLVNYTVSPISY